jgi:hypothetical protein
VVVGDADHSVTVTHSTSGVLAGPGATVAGSAAVIHVHETAGALVGGGAALAGASTRFSYVITDTVCDANGTPVPGATIHLFDTATDVEVDEVTSNGSGVFTFTNPTLGPNYYVVGYLAGSPDIAGTSVNTLQTAQV